MRIKENKKGVSYLHRTAQPSTFACFRTWRVEGSWSYKTYPGAKVYILFEGTMNLFGIEVNLSGIGIWRSGIGVDGVEIILGENLRRTILLQLRLIVIENLFSIAPQG